MTTALSPLPTVPQAEAVQALLESGADPNLQNLLGDTAAHIAARAGYLEVGVIDCPLPVGYGQERIVPPHCVCLASPYNISDAVFRCFDLFTFCV